MNSRISKTKLVVFFVQVFAALLLTMIFVFVFIYLREVSSNETILKNNEKHVAQIQKEWINGQLRLIVSDLHFLTELNELGRLFDQDPEAAAACARELLAFCREKKIYDQVRIIDGSGMEKIRINFRSGDPIIVPPAELQNKAQRPYFNDSFILKKRSVYSSVFDLNVEHNRIEEPRKPVLRLATPLFDTRGKKWGVLILNYLGATLINGLRIEDSGYTDKHGTLNLLNPQGYWLIGPTADLEWGFMREETKEISFAARYPQEWRQIAEESSGQFVTPRGLFTYETVNLASLFQDQSHLSEKTWKIVYTVSDRTLQTLRRAILIPFFIPAGIMIVVLAATALFLTRTRGKQLLAEKKLRRAALTDPLTGLGNRRALVQRFEYERARSQRYEDNICFIIGDLDYFKNINDTFGHDAGDFVLNRIARLLEENLRDIDQVARWGGEEFIIMLPATELRGCLITAEKLRAKIAEEKILFNGNELHVTISFGLSVYTPGSSFDDVLTMADKALYQAKTRGRNQVAATSD